MAKFYGSVGFAMQTETSPGVWQDSIVEKKYYGELSRHNWQVQSGTGVNDNLNLSNEISILADPFANKNLSFMRYVEFAGTKWKITNVEVSYPRLRLTIGGVYNES